MADVIDGAEPWSAEGGPVGVLVLHGFTGNHSSVRGLAEAFAGAGYSVEMPRLPGHGTSIEDLMDKAVAPSEDMSAVVEQLVEAGEAVMPGIGSDIAMPGVTESAYVDTPLAPLLSLFAASGEIGPHLGEVEQPLLLFTSPEDHVVPSTDSDFLAAAVSGPVERVTCERSYHVATQDYDKELINERSLEFVARISGD